jgi:hypothetical protein
VPNAEVLDHVSTSRTVSVSGGGTNVRCHLVLMADGRESLGVGSAAINPEPEREVLVKCWVPLRKRGGHPSEMPF